MCATPIKDTSWYELFRWLRAACSVWCLGRWRLFDLCHAQSGHRDCFYGLLTLRLGICCCLSQGFQLELTPLPPLLSLEQLKCIIEHAACITRLQQGKIQLLVYMSNRYDEMYNDIWCDTGSPKLQSKQGFVSKLCRQKKRRPQVPDSFALVSDEPEIPLSPFPPEAAWPPLACADG